MRKALFIIGMFLLLPALAGAAQAEIITVEGFTVSSGGTVEMQGAGYAVHDLKGESVIGTAESGAITADLGGLYVILSSVLGAAGGPNVSVVALLEGFTGRAATIQIEARTGGLTPDTATTPVATCEIALDADGAGTNNGSWEGNVPANGDYYLVIKHKLPNAEGNHLPIILGQKMTIAILAVASMEISDSNRPLFKTVYFPLGKVNALKTLANGKKAMRAGYLNNDDFIDVSDYAVWKAAVVAAGAAGTVDPNTPASVRSDLNGDGIIDVTDYSLWKGTVQDFAPGGVPQTTKHIYVP